MGESSDQADWIGRIGIAGFRKAGNRTRDGHVRQRISHGVPVREWGVHARMNARTIAAMAGAASVALILAAVDVSWRWAG